MRRRRGVFVLSLLLFLLLALLAPATAAPDGDPDPDGPGRLVLVLDSSGSMMEPVGGAGGQTRIAAAKAALGQVVEQLPDEAEVGLRVFGAEVFSRDEPGACEDTQSIVPVGPLDRKALTRAVADYRPYGETPIGRALEGAARDLGPAVEGKKRTIVLLSDGEPTCKPDPCDVAEELAKQGIDLTINVVGLDVNGAARRALRCIARAGGGTYYDAGSADELAGSLVKVSVRDVRGFVLDGQRVEGGSTAEKALPLEPGTYVDTARGEDKPRHYLVDKSVGGGVAVAALIRPPRGDKSWIIPLVVELHTQQGQRCSYALKQAVQVVGYTPITTAGTRVDQFTPAPSEECLDAEQLVASVEVGRADTDYRLQLTSYPAVENAESLPEALEDARGPWVANVDVPGSGPASQVAGGVSPDDAPELSPGTTHTDSVLASEQLVYKIPVAYGQAVRISARLAPEPRADEVLGIQGNPVSLNLISSSGTWLNDAFDIDRGIRGSGFYDGADTLLLTTAAPPVRVLNASSTDSQIAGNSQDGYVYAVLGMGLLDNERADDFAAPVRLRAELVGEPEGEPVYAGDIEGAPDSTTESPGAQPNTDSDIRPTVAEADGDTTVWLLLGGTALLVVLLAGGLVALRMRRRPTD